MRRYDKPDSRLNDLRAALRSIYARPIIGHYSHRYVPDQAAYGEVVPRTLANGDRAYGNRSVYSDLLHSLRFEPCTDPIRGDVGPQSQVKETVATTLHVLE